jgi:hypothetical protein
MLAISSTAAQEQLRCFATAVTPCPLAARADESLSAAHLYPPTTGRNCGASIRIFSTHGAATSARIDSCGVIIRGSSMGCGRRFTAYRGPSPARRGPWGRPSGQGTPRSDLAMAWLLLSTAPRGPRRRLTSHPPLPWHREHRGTARMPRLPQVQPP